MATETHRVCGLGITEPTIELFGQRYGACPMKQECPRHEACGYLRTRQILYPQNDSHGQ